MENTFIRASKQLHQTNDKYGAASQYSNPKSMKFLLTIPEAIKAAQEVDSIKSVLDHGTGQGGLIDTLNQRKDLEIISDGYDPGIAKFSTKPSQKYDIVTSIDVLEHIGKPYIHSTLKEISDLSGKFFFFCIDLLAASKKTSDGRNAHFLIAPSEWWIQEIKNHFKIMTCIETGSMPDGTDYPMHVFGCATQSMRNFKCMNTFLENVAIANKKWVWNNGTLTVEDYA